MDDRIKEIYKANKKAFDLLGELVKEQESKAERLLPKVGDYVYFPLVTGHYIFGKITCIEKNGLFWINGHDYGSSLLENATCFIKRPEWYDKLIPGMPCLMRDSEDEKWELAELKDIGEETYIALHNFIWAYATTFDPDKLGKITED